MTSEELNTALYQKMFAEQETYRGWLLTQPPDEILKHTYEYTVREDILMSLENNDLTDVQAAALLQSPGSLYDADMEDIAQKQDAIWAGLNEVLTRLSSVS